MLYKVLNKKIDLRQRFVRIATTTHTTKISTMQSVILCQIFINQPHINAIYV